MLQNNWKTTIAGIAMVILGAIQASRSENLIQAARDPHVQFAFVVGFLGIVAGDGKKAGNGGAQ